MSPLKKISSMKHQLIPNKVAVYREYGSFGNFAVMKGLPQDF
jgi:hypothetical protein